jgi:hypothetical protein
MQENNHMNKYFNISGPCIPGEHYMLPAQERCRGILDLVNQKQYFVIHAARQSGKTTLLFELTDQVNASGAYYALYCSLEALRGIRQPEDGIPRILDELRSAVNDMDALSGYTFAADVDPSQYTLAVREALSDLCKHLDKPLVIFFDEVDCLSNGTLITFLQQLRYGYVKRSRTPFVHSIALVGMRNIRDYRGKIREDRETLGSASPFNIVKRALTLRNFTREEIGRLYAQHSHSTGRKFPNDVVTAVYDATQGQPWLVNAIAVEIVEEILQHDGSQAITVNHVEQAVQRLILRRDTHIDSLMERLAEARVRRIVEPVILGEGGDYSLLDDDYRYVLDLGLLSESARGHVAPSNPIYGEVIIRTLSSRAQMAMQQQQYPLEFPAYLKEGRVDMSGLLKDFQQFWRENSEIWREKFDYQEAAPHLILQAFLQRVTNGGGRITCEMAGGRKRLDLCVEYLGQRYPIELKLRYDDGVYEEGQNQLAGYMDTLGCAEGWLIVFDRRKTISWNDKIFWKTTQHTGKTVHIVGC